MKKILSFAVLLLAFGVAANATQYKPGDIGPGGGIVFAVLDNNVWEVSEPLGTMTWDKAFKLCPQYHGGGCTDWYLPTKDELESIYYNLVEPGLLEDKETYWSSNQEESMTLWAYNYKKGRPGLYGAARKHAVRAVRHFEME